jgi:4-diphosphocytidyl-2-C-methyl-D-erythritol kinase
MSETETRLLSVFAPAKINLYLHITGRLDNGYHLLDSLVAFADIGDEISIVSAHGFEFSIEGPYANAFGPKDRDCSPDSSNLVVQAVWMLARAAQKVPNVRIRLTKNLPLASGIGGGSSDAAAVIWGLLEWWKIPKQAPYVQGLMMRLGADVPVCLNCRPARVRGIGDVLDPAPGLAEIPVVLVNPGRPCVTSEAFSRFAGKFREPVAFPPGLEKTEALVSFLRQQDNDLLKPALEMVPEIGNILSALDAEEGCVFTRMSGSGATCFGLFENEVLAMKAAQDLARNNPDWWVKKGWLNRPERY